MHYKYFFTGILFFLLCLLFVKYHRLNSKEQEVTLSPLIDLVESTHIIRQLINQNLLETVLEEHDPEQLSILLDNFSPAAMAFESEVLSTTIPLVVVCYCNKNDVGYESLVQQLERLAFQYDDRIKFVIVDVQLLFSLAQNAVIENTPTILIIKDREEIDRFEEIDLFENALALCSENLIILN